MPLKKQTFNADEIEIYDEAVMYKRGLPKPTPKLAAPNKPVANPPKQPAQKLSTPAHVIPNPQPYPPKPLPTATAYH